MLHTTTVITNKLMPINNCLEHSGKSDRYISTPAQNKCAGRRSRAFCTARARDGSDLPLQNNTFLPPVLHATHGPGSHGAAPAALSLPDYCTEMGTGARCAAQVRGSCAGRPQPGVQDTHR